MSKELFIWYKRSKGILEGGGQGSQRVFQLCQRALGEDAVDSYYIHDEYQPKRLTDYLRAVVYFPMGYYYGLTPARVKEIVERAKAYDIVWIDRSLFGIIAKALHEAGYKGKIIVFFHNVERVYFDEAKLPKHLPFRSVLLRCVTRNERWSVQFADSMLALNERDSAELKRLYGREADMLSPVSMRDRFEPQDEEIMTNKRLRCLTIGAYFGPNNEGILWFVKNVLPRVDIEYKVVGKGMGKLKAEHPEELKNIEVISDAPTLAPYFYEADCMILPIFSGSGMKVKTCESLMYGKNILATDEAFEGYEMDYDLAGAKCNTADEFVAAINRLEQNPVPRHNAYSRSIFLSQYSEQAQVEGFKELLTK